MVFELARDGAFDGPVAGIVDARSHFVGEQAAIVLEELDGQYPDVFQDSRTWRAALSAAR